MAVTESILTSIKELLGSIEEYTPYDNVIIMHINDYFSVLTELGVGPPDGFAIEDDKAVWNDFTGGNKKLASVKTYIYLKVKLVFDPPENSSVLESMKRTADEKEWRLKTAAEGGS